MIPTPSGRAPAPVVAPEDASRPKPQTAPVPVSPAPAAKSADADDDDDYDDDDEYDEEDDDGDGDGSAKASGPVNLSLRGLSVNAVNKPMGVAVWANGDARLSSATIAIKFDERLLRINRVESSGVFDGKLGARLPFEVRNGVLYVSLSRPQNLTGQPVNGQLMTIIFDVLGAGATTVAIQPDASRGVGLDSAVAAVRVGNPLVVTMR